MVIRKSRVSSVSLDNPGSKNAWLKAVQEDHLPWTQVSGLSGNISVVELYAIENIPQNFLVDPDGKIVAKNLRGDDLINELQKLLDK